jgi:sugar lactone lactonase YvrE
LEELECRLLLDGLMFPEAPRWWDGELWFADIYGLEVKRMRPDGSDVRTVARVEGWPSGLGRLPDGTVICNEMRTQKVHRIEADGTVSPFADLAGLARHEINDSVTDANGRTYVGCYGFDSFNNADPAPGNLSLIEPDGSARVVAEDLMFPNGLAISEDGRTLAVAQTLGAEITAFDVADDGSLSGQRTWASLPGTTPDGLCWDAAGALWMGSVFTSEFLRVEEGGNVTHRIAAPSSWALAPMLAGPDRQTLYLMSTDTDPDRLLRNDMVGRIDTVRVDVPGVGLP